ncbi:MAG: hypothetical protein JOZ02_23375 [Acidobacteria bacterium]|nr:hypothetical protein [Acidobacteriota bacterium]
MDKVWSRRTFLGGAALLAMLLAAAAPSRAQDDRQTRYAIERAQIGVSGKIIQERGGTWGDVTFDPARTQTWHISDRLTGVRGEGRHAPNGSNSRAFTYEATVNHRNGSIERVTYDWVRGGGGGGVGGGGRDDRAPRWLVGSFQGRSPSNRRRVNVTVGRDGQVSAIYDNGSRDEGTYDNGRIRFNNSDVWDVSRVDEGFRAAAGTRSEVFQSGSGGSYNDNTDDNNDGRVPRWARGTFRGTTDSGESELVIRADGSATARSLTKNQSFQGTYSNGRLRFDWGTFDVQREGDGIRTIQTDNRNNQTSYRRTGN